MKNYIILLIVMVGALSSCDNSTPYYFDKLTTKVDSVKTSGNYYGGKVLTDSLNSIAVSIYEQKTRFALFRTFKYINIRIQNLNDAIDAGEYKSLQPNQPNKEKVIMVYPIPSEGLPVDIYVYNIDGKEYIYSFSKYGNYFTTVPKK